MKDEAETIVFIPKHGLIKETRHYGNHSEISRTIKRKHSVGGGKK